MKPLVFGLLAAAMLVTAAPAAQAAEPDNQTAAAKARAIRQALDNGWHRRYQWKKGAAPRRTARAPRKLARPAAVPAVARAAGKKGWALPEYQPTYNSAGRYVPTTYIYQQTSGEFRILQPTPAPAAPGAPNAAAQLRDALRGINQQGAPGLPAPPAVPGAPAAPGGQPAAAGAPGAPAAAPAAAPAGVAPAAPAGQPAAAPAGQPPAAPGTNRR